jgi:secreted trypsin-like serine protease
VGIISPSYDCNSITSGSVYTRLSPYIEWMKNVTNSSITTYISSYTESMKNVTKPSSTVYSSSLNNNGISGQRRNNFMFEILFLLIVMFL